MRAGFALAMFTLSFWAAMLASTVTGSRWMAETILAGVFFLAGIVASHSALTQPHRRSSRRQR